MPIAIEKDDEIVAVFPETDGLDIPSHPEAPQAKGLMKLMLLGEKKLKETVWDCRMCGQCILHSTGITCPMTCPKNLRNGPCSGTMLNGNCEVKPEMPCVWRLAWERSRKMPVWRSHMSHINPPVDFRLKGTGSWENLVTGRDKVKSPGWQAYDDSHAAAH